MLPITAFPPPFRFAVFVAFCALTITSCAPAPPHRYLAVTHSALDRVSFFDLDARKLVGVLPTQKLPHDMLLGADGRTLYIVNTGAQCISTYDLGSPATWRAARAFMVSDTSRATARSIPNAPPKKLGLAAIPAGLEHHHLTSPTFPERAQAVHEQRHAFTHNSCTDCHDRSVGAKPFAPQFIDNKHTIRLVHLAACDITELDAATLAVKRRVPLPIPAGYAPVEAWVQPGTQNAFVTCRDSIGKGLPGLIAIVNLATGAPIRTLVPGIYPWHMVPSPDGTKLYVNLFQSSRIAVVDLARQALVDTLIAENGPAAILPMDGGRTLLVSCFYTHAVLLLDPARHTVLRRYPVGSNPTMLLLTGEGRRVWVLCGGESELQMLDLDSGRILERHKLLFGAYAMLLVPPGATPR